jgi:hypothetical protein
VADTTPGGEQARPDRRHGQPGTIGVCTAASDNIGVVGVLPTSRWVREDTTALSGELEHRERQY